MLLLNVPFLVFLFCFLALAILSLFTFEKIFRFTYYHTVLKAVLQGLILFCFFHLNAGYCNAVGDGGWIFSNFSIKHFKVKKLTF